MTLYIAIHKGSAKYPPYIGEAEIRTITTLMDCLKGEVGERHDGDTSQIDRVLEVNVNGICRVVPRQEWLRVWYSHLEESEYIPAEYGEIPSNYVSQEIRNEFGKEIQNYQTECASEYRHQCELASVDAMWRY